MFHINGLSLLDFLPTFTPKRFYGPGIKNPHKNITLKAYNAATSDDRPPFGRQQTRAAVRRFEKQARQADKLKAQKQRARDLLDRQAEREKSGFYAKGVSVATALAHKRAGRLHRRVLIDDIAKAKGDNLVRLG